MPKALAFIILAGSLLLACPHARAQKTAAQQLAAARPTYYTPTAAGLQSLHCDLNFDWKAFFTQAGGKPVSDDLPLLAYLKTVHLAVDDSLRGQGSLVWREATPPPDSIKANADQMHSAFSQMISGFFQSWNGFMNGNMVPAPDANTSVTRTADGLHLHATDKDTIVDEDFDKNVLLTSAHVVLPTLDVVMHPIYTETPDGRIVATMDSLYRQPPTAPAAHLTMAIDYQQVSGFRIPATLVIGIANTGKFNFTFANCSVGKTP